MERTIKFPIEERKNLESPMLLPRNLSRATSIEDTTFRFPDELDHLPKYQKTPVVFAPKLSKRAIPSCAKGSTFCETIDDYPEDHINNILQNKLDEFKSFIGTDIVKESGITHKIDGVDENTLCASYEHLAFPKAAENSEDKWFYVVNQDSYKQGIRIESCLETNGQACAFTDQFPLGYKTVCKQKFIYRKLLAVDDKGEPITDNFKLPSCCSCVVKQESLRARIGSLTRHPLTPATQKPKK